MSRKMHSLLQPDDHIIDDSIRLYINDQPTCFPQHRNMAYEMIMAIENTYAVTVDNDPIVLNEGDLIIIPTGIVHEITAPPTGLRYIFMVDRDRLFSVDGLLAMESCFYPYLLVRADSTIHTARFPAAVQAYTAEKPLNHSAAHLELSMMLVSLLQERFPNWVPEKRSCQTKKDQRQLLFSDISNYITNHCTEDLTVQEIADSAGYSRYYFERMFEEYMNISFHNFLVRKRIDYSKHLLLLSSDTITEIAHQSGFSSIATFNRVFKALEGTSPSAYREQHAK